MEKSKTTPGHSLAKLYSFTPPAEILLIIYFEQKQNTIKIGITEIATAR